LEFRRVLFRFASDPVARPAAPTPPSPPPRPRSPLPPTPADPAAATARGRTNRQERQDAKHAKTIELERPPGPLIYSRVRFLQPDLSFHHVTSSSFFVSFVSSWLRSSSSRRSLRLGVLGDSSPQAYRIRGSSTV